MRRIALSAAALLMVTSVSLAQNKHPADIAAIDAALRTAKISPAQRAEVVKLRNQGQQLYDAGKHG